MRWYAEKCKDLFEISMQGTADVNENWSDEEKSFYSIKTTSRLLEIIATLKLG